MRRKTGLLVIDPEGLLRDGPCAVLQQGDALHLEGAFANARVAARTRSTLRPDVVAARAAHSLHVLLIVR